MKYLPYIYLLIVITTACEQVVEIDIPEHEPQLVLSSFYKAGDAKITAYLTKSLSILSNEDPDNVSDATIKLYENDVLVGQFEKNFNPSYYLLELSAPLTEGKTYKITAETTDYEAISAIQRIPVAPEIINVGYFPLSRLGIDGSLKDGLRVTFQDTPASDNYYEFRAY